uniref:Uncharacterized protein n=1 Tax=Spironucleus salmonicida TaxID=348837 RepID=V6LMW8_9EUKA|eukprot:EST45975.1 Hypothetical protein SS50377_13954 [Spironucleus salmonicida]
MVKQAVSSNSEKKNNLLFDMFSNYGKCVDTKQNGFSRDIKNSINKAFDPSKKVQKRPSPQNNIGTNKTEIKSDKQYIELSFSRQPNLVESGEV